MFGKKKPVFNPYNSHYETTFYEIRSIRGHLMKCVRSAYYKNAAVDVYPDGPDKDLAIKEVEKAKRAVLVAIGSYDTAVNEFNNWYKSNKDKLTDFTYPEWNPATFDTSHKIVELAIQITMKGGDAGW